GDAEDPIGNHYFVNTCSSLRRAFCSDSDRNILPRCGKAHKQTPPPLQTCSPAGAEEVATSRATPSPAPRTEVLGYCRASLRDGGSVRHPRPQGLKSWAIVERPYGTGRK